MEREGEGEGAREAREIKDGDSPLSGVGNLHLINRSERGENLTPETALFGKEEQRETGQSNKPLYSRR